MDVGYRWTDGSSLFDDPRADGEVIRVPVLVGGFAHAADGFGRGYSPLLKVSGNRRIAMLAGSARIGLSALAMFLLTKNWSSMLGSLLYVEGAVGRASDHRPGEVP